MLNPKIKLSEKIFTNEIEQKPTRDGYGSFIEFYKKTVNAMILCAVFFIIAFLFINIADAASINIIDDATGGDCFLIGVWDLNAKTCALITDLNDSLIIEGNGITLDGANHQIVGNNAGSGIIIDSWNNIVVKNLKIQNFAYGVYVSDSENNLITNSIISDNSEIGIVLSNSHGNIITENIISNNQISGLEIWYVVLMSDNKIYRNNFLNNGKQIYAMYDANDFFYQSPPIGGNYWSNFDELIEGCIDLNSNNFCDFSYVFNENGQDNYSWTKQNGWKISQNQPPTISNLNQYKSDEQTEISESGITTESSPDNPYNSIAVFKATLTDPDNDQVKFQVELKEFNQLFDEQNLLESGFVSSGSETTITRYGLIDGKYKWRAKVIDDKSNASDWQEFGTAGNVDFEVKLVPLYTQIVSQYPPRTEEEEWANLDYAEGGIGTYSCAKNTNATIARCGCAIVSAAMIVRYYDIAEAQGKDVNPGTINEWLKIEPGGYVNGDVNWIAAAKYTDWRIKYEKTDISTNNYILLDEKLNNYQPVIAKANAGRGGINRQHFFVIDNKLASTYGVKDPAWYNTKNLADSRIDDYIRNYENGFDGLRIYKKGDGIAQSAITIALGSPAELLITDSLGRKLGKDENGVEYNEIPNASYFEDGFDNPFGENPPFQERNKLIQILEPLDGAYNLQVIGTGEGVYSLQSTFYDTRGSSQSQKFKSETVPGIIAQYNTVFNSTNVASTTIKLFDETPPEVEIYFNSDTQKLTIKGTDNTTVNPIVSIIQSLENTENDNEADNEEEDEKDNQHQQNIKHKAIIYQIQDEAGNTAKLLFEKVKQEGKQIKAELKSIQYNNESIIELPKIEFKYEWSLDKKTNQAKEIEQRIKVKDNFDIKAKYNHQKNETKIEIKEKDKKKFNQTLSGLAIIKLITKEGNLWYEIEQSTIAIQNHNDFNRFFDYLFLTAYAKTLENLGDSYFADDDSLKNVLSSFTDWWKKVFIVIKERTLIFFQSIRSLLIRSVFKQSTPDKRRSLCLAEDEKVSYKVEKNPEGGGKATIFIQNKDNGQELFNFQIIISNYDHYHPIELHKCGAYAIRTFGYDYQKKSLLYDYRRELWIYSYDGNGRMLISDSARLSYENILGDFRIDPNEKYIVLEKGYLGKDDYSLVIKDLKTKEDILVLSAKEIAKQYPNIIGSFGFDKWTDDGRYFWGDIFDGAYVNGFFRIDVQNWKTDIYEAPKDVLGGDALNIENGWITVHPGNEWYGFADMTEEEKEKRRKQGIGTELYIYNLFTGERKFITKTSEPLWYFKPKWLSDTELEYELPSGEKKIYEIKPK